MRCPKCGYACEDNLKICPKCNAPIEDILEELYELKKMSSGLNDRINNLETRIKQGRIPRAPAKKEHREIPAESESLETRIGLRWFNKIGLLAIFIGTALFLRYAFVNNWIGVLGRVLLGVFSGIGLVIAGEFTKRRNYNIFSEGLTAGGFSLVYLSVYAAFNFYHLLGAIPAFLLIVSVILFSGLYSIRLDSARLLTLTIIGGFLTPIIMNVKGASVCSLMTYILLLDAGVLLVNYYKKWEYCNLLALIFTYITYFSLYSSSFAKSSFLMTEIFITSFFLLFILISIFYNFIHKQKTTAAEMAIIIVNGISYFLANYFLLIDRGVHAKKIGFLAAALSGVYALFYFSALKRTKGKDKRLIFTYLSLALLFATFIIPIELKKQWLLIGYVIESVILIWLGFKVMFKGIRITGVFMALFALSTLIFSYSSSWIGEQFHFDFRPLLNERFFTYIVFTICGFVSAYLYEKNKDKLSFFDESNLSRAFGLTACILLLVALSQEVSSYFKCLIHGSKYFGPAKDTSIEGLKMAQRFTMSALWMIYSFALVAIGIFRKIRGLRIVAIILFAATILKVFLIDTSEVAQIWRIFSFIGLGIILILTSLLYQKYKDKLIDFIR